MLNEWRNIEKVSPVTIWLLDYQNSIQDHCCCSVTQSPPILCNPMERSTPGLPDPQHLPKLAQVHVHCIGDAIQPYHPLMPSFTILLLLRHKFSNLGLLVAITYKCQGMSANLAAQNLLSWPPRSKQPHVQNGEKLTVCALGYSVSRTRKTGKKIHYKLQGVQS